MIGDVIEAPQIDLYAWQRGSLVEQMAVLAGRGCWRDPENPWIPRSPTDPMPYEHVLASAVHWLQARRLDKTDVSGEILHGLAIMHMQRCDQDRCVDAIVTGLVDMSAKLARMQKASGIVDACTRVALVQCVSGYRVKYPPRATRSDCGLFDGFVTRIIWAQGEQGLRRAKSALAAT